MSKFVNVAELKDNIAEYLTMAEKGQEVIVCRRNVPIVRMERLKSGGAIPASKMFGCMNGTVKVQGDLTEPCIPEADWEVLK